MMIYFFVYLFTYLCNVMKSQMISWLRSSWLLTRPVTLKSWTHRDLPCRIIFIPGSWWFGTSGNVGVGPSQIMRIGMMEPMENRGNMIFLAKTNDASNWCLSLSPSWFSRKVPSYPGPTGPTGPKGSLLWLARSRSASWWIKTTWMFIPKNFGLRDLHLKQMVICFRKCCNTMVSELFEPAVLSVANKKMVPWCYTHSTDQIRTSPFTLDCSIVTSSWVGCRNFCWVPSP